jgi:4-alpha-glucanotransferase
MTADEDLQQRAESLGIQTWYADVRGDWHPTDPEVLRLVTDLLEHDAHDTPTVADPVVVGTWSPVQVHGTLVDAELRLCDGTVVPVHPDRERGQIGLPGDLPWGCHELHVETSLGRGITTVVVAPSSMPRMPGLHGTSGLFVPAYALWDDDQPLPSFGLLGRLAERLGALDTAALTTLPLYAAFLDEPFDPSPYAPASRLHWNELYLDDAGLPPSPVPAQGRYLDWRTLAARRRDQLLRAVDGLDDRGRAELEAFVAARPDVGRWARFAAGRAGAGDDPRVVTSHELAQLLADRELATVSSGPGATLAIDLPIGCHPDGYERWAHPELFAPDLAIGAPPDIFFAEGQNWGLPPQLPGAARRSGYQLWRDLLRRAGEHASLLRIDHVMAVHRLWWVPNGFGAHQGVYVRYPREELLAVIAATAAETGTTVVGEDLGTVPEEVSEALARWRMLGMYEEQFHAFEHQLGHIPARSVAGIRTHDMQPFRAFHDEQGAGLDGYRGRLADSLGHHVGDGYWALLDSVLERLAASPASLVTVDLDDLLGEPEPHNVPGRVGDTTWRRRLDRSLSATFDDPELQRRLRLLGGRHGVPDDV